MSSESEQAAPIYLDLYEQENALFSFLGSVRISWVLMFQMFPELVLFSEKERMYT